VVRVLFEIKYCFGCECWQVRVVLLYFSVKAIYETC
jgi:hypothetical protein